MSPSERWEILLREDYASAPGVSSAGAPAISGGGSQGQDKLAKAAEETLAETKKIAPVWANIGKFAAPLAAAIGTITFVFEMMKRSKVFSTFMDSFLSILSAFIDIAMVNLMPFLIPVLKWLVGLLPIWIDFWNNPGEKVKGWFQSLFDILGNIFSGVVEGLSLFIGNIGNFLSNVIEALTSGTSKVWEAIKGKAIEIWNSILEMAINVWNSIKNFVINIWGNIMSYASNIWNSILNIASNVWSAVQNVALSVWQSIVNTATSVWQAIVNIAAQVWVSIGNVAGQVWQSIVNIAAQSWQGISNFAASVWQGISTGWQSIINWIIGVLRSIGINAGSGYQTRGSQYPSGSFEATQAAAASVEGGQVAYSSNRGYYVAGPGDMAGITGQDYQKGTPYVPRNMLALLHRGERVVPADENRANLSNMNNKTFNVNNTFNMTSDVSPLIAWQIRKSFEEEIKFNVLRFR